MTPCRAREFFIGPARDGDPSITHVALVGAGKHAVEARVAMVVAVAQAQLAVDLIVEQPRGERPGCGLDLRDVEVDAAARAAAVMQPRGERGRDKPGRETVGDRPVRADRLAIGPAGERVVARERGALSAETGIVLVRPGLTVQARTDHDEIGLDRRRARRSRVRSPSWPAARSSRRRRRPTRRRAGARARPRRAVSG